MCACVLLLPLRSMCRAPRDGAQVYLAVRCTTGLDGGVVHVRRALRVCTGRLMVAGAAQIVPFQYVVLKRQLKVLRLCLTCVCQCVCVCVYIYV